MKSRVAICASVAALLVASSLLAQDPDSRPQNNDSDLAGQVTKLRARVARLEAALQSHQPAGGMQKGMGMGGMKKGMGMGGMKKGMGMGGMRMMGQLQESALAGSQLPGFPGASHLYHIGASDFFLDHADHIQLSAAQIADLNRLREKALLAQSTGARAIQEAEQELWTLTSVDQPESSRIEAKIGEIGRLQGDVRMNFIRAVGAAASLLTDEQRQLLVGEPTPPEVKNNDQPESSAAPPKTPAPASRPASTR